MESVRRVHLWEMIRYQPNIFFTLNSVSKGIQTILESDVSYIQYFLEDMYGKENIRDSSFVECKSLLVDLLSRNSILLNIPQGSGSIVAWDLKKKQKQVLDFPVNSFDAAGWTWLKGKQFFICGWKESRESYLLDLSNFSKSTVVHKADMNHPRCGQGIVKYQNSVFVFGGYAGNGLDSAEKYSISQDTWQYITFMPIKSIICTAVVIDEKIYITGYNMVSIYEYDPLEDSYRNYQLPKQTGASFLIPQHNNILVGYDQDDKAMKVSKNGKVLETCYFPRIEFVIQGSFAYDDEDMYFISLTREGVFKIKDFSIWNYTCFQ